MDKFGRCADVLALRFLPAHTLQLQSAHNHCTDSVCKGLPSFAATSDTRLLPQTIDLLLLTDHRWCPLYPLMPCLVTTPHITTKSSHFVCTFTKAIFAAPVGHHQGLYLPHHRSDSLLSQFRRPDANTTHYAHILPTLTHKSPLHETWCSIYSSWIILHFARTNLYLHFLKLTCNQW
jgi:hypothetical protein